MKFLKVLSTGAIAAAILASMSATAFAADEDDADFDEDAFSLDYEDFEDDDTFDDADLTGETEDDEEFSLPDAQSSVKVETDSVADAQASAADFAADTEDDDKDTFADAEESDEDEYTAADADFGYGSAAYGKYYGKTYSWSYWDYSTKFWESTEFAPANVPANATVFDVVNAAYNAGINSLNIQNLSNFLILNEENFTSDDYAAFIATIYAIKEEIIDEHVHEIFGPAATAGGLEESDRGRLYTALNRDEKDAISAAIINVTNAHRVLVSFDLDADGYPLMYASMRHRIADTPVSSSTTTTTNNTQIQSGSVVAATGGELPETGSTGAAAFASIALGLACVGAVIVARKNRA